MTTHTENQEQCSRIFIPWSWAVGILAGLFIATGTITWAAARNDANVHTTLIDHETRIEQLENMRVNINIVRLNQDTIKNLIREIQYDRFAKNKTK